MLLSNLNVKCYLSLAISFFLDYCLSKIKLNDPALYIGFTSSVVAISFALTVCFHVKDYSHKYMIYGTLIPSIFGQKLPL